MVLGLAQNCRICFALLTNTLCFTKNARNSGHQSLTIGRPRADIACLHTNFGITLFCCSPLPMVYRYRFSVTFLRKSPIHVNNAKVGVWAWGQYTEEHLKIKSKGRATRGLDVFC